MSRREELRYMLEADIAELEYEQRRQHEKIVERGVEIARLRKAFDLLNKEEKGDDE